MNPKRRRRRVRSAAAALTASALILALVPAPAVSAAGGGENPPPVAAAGEHDRDLNNDGDNRDRAPQQRELQHQLLRHDGSLDADPRSEDPRFTVSQYESSNARRKKRYRRAYWSRIHRINYRIRQRQRKKAAIEKFVDLQTHYDGFVVDLLPLCGENPDGSLTERQKEDLVKALGAYLNDEAGCDGRTDERTEGVQILDFVGGGDCFAPGGGGGNRLLLGEQDQVIDRVKSGRLSPPTLGLRGLQAIPDPPPEHAAREREKKRTKGVLAGRRSSFRAARKLTCRRCRTRSGSSAVSELAEDTFNPSGGRANRDRGGVGNNGRALLEEDFLPSWLRGDTEEEDAVDGRALEQADPFPSGEPSPGCDADLVRTINDSNFPDVDEAEISEWRELGCSAGSDTCLDPDSGCCGAPSCACPAPWRHPTCPYADRNEGGTGAWDEFHTFEQRVRIEGLCGDSAGGTAMSEEQRGRIEADLLERGRNVLADEGVGCVVDEEGAELGLSISSVDVLQFKAAWFCDRSGEAANAAAKAEEQGSVVTMAVRGRCSQFFCLGRYPSGYP